MHVALLHLVGLKPPQREAGQVAGAGADAAQGHARHALHWISCYEGASLIHVLGQAHVAEGGVIRPRHHLKEVVVLGKVFCRIMWILERADLHLRFQERGAVRLVAGVLQVRDAFWRGVCLEGHEGAQQL